MLELGNIMGYIIGVIGTTATITATIIIYITGKKVNVDVCNEKMKAVSLGVKNIADLDSTRFTQTSGNALDKRISKTEVDVIDVYKEIRENQTKIIELINKQNIKLVEIDNIKK